MNNDSQPERRVFIRLRVTRVYRVKENRFTGEEIERKLLRLSVGMPEVHVEGPLGYRIRWYATLLAAALTFGYAISQLITLVV